MSRRLLNLVTSSAGSGQIINATIYRNNTRIVLQPTSSVNNLFSFSVVKQKSAASSYLIVRGVVPGHGLWNNPTIGMFVNIDGARMDTDQDAYGGFYHAGPPQTYEQTLLAVEKSFESSAWDSNQNAGSHAINIGWYSPGGSTRPCITINPNTSDEGRYQQTGSHILCLEIAR